MLTDASGSTMSVSGAALIMAFQNSATVGFWAQGSLLFLRLWFCQRRTTHANVSTELSATHIHNHRLAGLSPAIVALASRTILSASAGFEVANSVCSTLHLKRGL